MQYAWRVGMTNTNSRGKENHNTTTCNNIIHSFIHSLLQLRLMLFIVVDYALIAD